MLARRLTTILFFSALVFLITFPFCADPSKESADEYINHHDSVTYVGAQVCASCHLDKYETFMHTGMGQSFDTASRTKSAAKFSKNHLLYDSVRDFYYQPFWKNEALYVREFRMAGQDTVFQRVERIDYIIGSGQHTNSHLIKKGDYIVQAPFTWYAQKQKLDFPPGFEDGNNSRFSRVIDIECMGCHNALPTMKAEPRAFQHVPKGISCERCHGPGSAHVAFRQLGGDAKGGVDRTIVNPSKLTWQRQMDVCQRCHLQGNNVLKPGKSFSDFRPGMVLSDVFEIYLPAYEDGGSQFNMANHADRLQSSKCFIVSNQKASNQKGLSCITCHNPHKSVKTLNANHFNQACVSCHSTKQQQCKLPLSIRKLDQDNCVKCHMPASGTEDIPHVLVHDHKIGVHKTPIMDKSKSKVVGLYCVNNPEPEVQTQIKAYLTYYEKFDPLPIYQQKAEELLRENPDAASYIHLYYQKQLWSKIKEIQTKSQSADFDAITCYRLGKAFHHLKDYTTAVNWLELAILKDDQYFEYTSELSATYIKLGDFNKSKQLADQCLKQFPEYQPAFNNKAFSHIMLNQFSEAKKALTNALALDPDNVTTIENLVLLYDRQNNLEQVGFWLRYLLKVDPNHASAKKRLLTLKS